MAPTARTAPNVRARLLTLALLPLLILCLSGRARAQTSATYHLHKEPTAVAPTTSGFLQLKTAGPDAVAFAIQTANLKNVAAGEYQIKSFETQTGVPNLSGTIPAGSTVTFSLYMRKTSTSGVVYPRAKLYLNGASGALLCNVTGATALTTTITKYTLTATTSAAVSLATTDRFFVWVGVNVATAPSANTNAELNVEGTLNGNYDSQVAVPLPNNPPSASITSPANNASFTGPANITINANASDSDGTVSQVEFFQGGTLLGTDPSSPYSFVWNNVPQSSYPYAITARATDNRGFTTTSSPVNVTVTGGGTVGGASSSPAPPAPADLTSEGLADWAHWGLGSPTSFDHKGGVTQKISNFSLVNAASSSRLTDNPTTFTWTDGTPAASATNTQTGVFVSGAAGTGFQFTAPADTNVRTLKVYVGLWYAQGKLEASLSDASALAYVDTSLSSNTGTKNGVYTINYKAASAGQTLTVRYTLLNNFNSPYGNVTLEAATLAGGPPVLNGISPSTGVAGTAVTLTGENFGATQGTSTVTFNGTAATPTSWGNTSITVNVPAGVTTGPVVVNARGLASGGVNFTILPTVNSLTPTSGLRGTSVGISGTSFGATQGASTVTFNGVAASVTAWSNTNIVAVVPATATAGPVVVTAGGTPSNGVNFNVITAGTLAGAVTRTSDNGPVDGATVEALQAGAVKGTATTAPDGTYTMTNVEAGTYTLRVTAVGCQPATRDGVVVSAGASRTENFLLENVGSLSGKVTEPNGVTAVAGATVKLVRGPTVVNTATANASGDFAFANVEGGNYMVEASAPGYLSTAQPTLVTGNANTTVNVSLNVTNGGPVTYVYDELGRLVSASTPTETAVYKYDAVGNLLSIQRQDSSLVTVTEFTPNGGTAGTPVTIYGTGFSATAGQNAVAFNGTAAAVTSATANEIRTSVPAGASTGVVTVTTPAGSATSAAPFTVNPAGAPSISGFTPSVGPAGTLVTVSGSNFETVATDNRVKVNRTSAVVTSAAANSLVARVSNASGSGRVSVTTPAGTAVSGADFYVTPAPYTAANVESTGRMSVNESRPVSITTADKVALLIFDAAAGRSVSARLTGSNISGGTATIYRPDGTFLNSTNISTNGDFMDATYLPQTGTYTIMIDPSGTNTGSLTLTLYEVVHITDPIIAGGAAVPTTVGTPGQNVALTFNGTAGQRVSVGVTGNSYGYVMWDTLDAKILDPSGNVLGSVGLNGSGANVFIDTVTLPVTGTYRVSLNPPGIRTGSATFTLYDVVDVTGSITPGGASVTTSNSTPGQNMRLSFQGAAGQKVSVVSAVSGFTSWPRSYILRPDGTALTGPASEFLDAVVLPVAGTYTLLCDPLDGSTGTATFTAYNVTDLSGEVVAGGAAVPVSLTTPGQNMAMTFQGTAGRKMTLTLTNNWFGFIWYGNTYVKVNNPDGSVLGQLDVNAGSGPLFLDAMTLPSTGTYTITLDPPGQRTGGFQMNLNEVQDVTGTIAADGVAVTKTTNAPGQNVRLTFGGAAGQKVNLSVATSGSGFTGAPLLYILRPDGSVLVGPANFSMGPVTLPAAGTYTVFSDPVDVSVGTQTFTLTTVP